MKVMLCTRGDYYRNFAGDSMQVLKLAYYLRKRGVNVEINDGAITDYSAYDIIHLFNLNRMGETYKHYKLAHKFNKNIVISPLYWDLSSYYKFINHLEGLKLSERCNLYREEILRGCKKIFPNSYIEENLLKKKFQTNSLCHVIYNGVDVEPEDTPLYNFKDRYNFDNYILSVGRISPEKNQLTLCKVCDRLGLQLVLIGNAGNQEYFKQCIKYHNVTYLGFMDSYNIYNAYRFARLHILPGFFETPGLSSLEAAASGCILASTEEGSAREYFKDMAIYCSPYDEKSIELSIVEALKSHKLSKLKEYVRSNYSWEKSTDDIFKYYQETINNSI